MSSLLCPRCGGAVKIDTPGAFQVEGILVLSDAEARARDHFTCHDCRWGGLRGDLADAKSPSTFWPPRPTARGAK